MIVSSGLTVPVAVTPSVTMPRATGTVTYCTLLFVPSPHSHTAIPAMIMIEAAVAASPYFPIPNQLFLAVDGGAVNFTTLPRLSTSDASELTLVVISRIH